MVEFEKRRFRKRNYETELGIAKNLNVRSLPFKVILDLRIKLNQSRYKSEVWFKKILFVNFEHETKCYLNYPILNRFFVDFYFKELRLAVEIDGSSHIGREEYDDKRDKLINQCGIKVIRLKAFDDEKAINFITTLINSYNERKKYVTEVVKEKNECIRLRKWNRKNYAIKKKKEFDDKMIRWSLGKGESPIVKLRKKDCLK